MFKYLCKINKKKWRRLKRIAGGVLTALLFNFLNILGGRHAMKINFGRSTFFQWAKSTIVKIKELKHVLKEKYVIFVHVRLTVEDLIK